LYYISHLYLDAMINMIFCFNIYLANHTKTLGNNKKGLWVCVSHDSFLFYVTKVMWAFADSLLAKYTAASMIRGY